MIIYATNNIISNQEEYLKEKQINCLDLMECIHKFKCNIDNPKYRKTLINILKKDIINKAKILKDNISSSIDEKFKDIDSLSKEVASLLSDIKFNEKEDELTVKPFILLKIFYLPNASLDYMKIIDQKLFYEEIVKQANNINIHSPSNCKSSTFNLEYLEISRQLVDIYYKNLEEIKVDILNRFNNKIDKYLKILDSLVLKTINQNTIDDIVSNTIKCSNNQSFRDVNIVPISHIGAVLGIKVTKRF